VTALRLGLLALLAGAIAVAALAWPSEPHPPQFVQAHDVRAADTSHKLFTGPDRAPELLHRLELETRCPTLAIEWTSTNVEPTTPDSWAIVELRLDGRVVQRAYFGAGVGVYEDGPARLLWRGAAPPGPHTVEAWLHGGGAVAAWGLPYTDPPHVGLDTLVAQDDPPAGARPATCAA
jgi:hypothetical protein